MDLVSGGSDRPIAVLPPVPRPAVRQEDGCISACTYAGKGRINQKVFFGELYTLPTGPGSRARRCGRSLAELFERFPADASAERWWADQRWPEGLRCAHDERADVSTDTDHPSRPCRRCFSAQTGTVMHGSNRGYRTWATAIYLPPPRPKGPSSLPGPRDLGATQKTAWDMDHRIRLAGMKGLRPAWGPAEADQICVGAREQNKHAAPRKGAGHGTVGKTPLLGLRDRATAGVPVPGAPDGTRDTIQGFVRARLRPGAYLFTDEADGPFIAHRWQDNLVQPWIQGEAFRDPDSQGIAGFHGRMIPPSPTSTFPMPRRNSGDYPLNPEDVQNQRN